MKTIQKLIFGTPEEKWKNGCGILFLILGILSFFVCLFQAFGQDIWYDEVFSVNFIQHSYKEIAVLTGKDVHPPLYYWYLKLFHDIGKVLVPAASPIVLCKLASMLPFVGIFVYTLTMIRKNFGLHVAGLFWFLLMTMPQISNYTVEIRMYSLALFFITAAFLHSCELVRAFPLREGTVGPGTTKHWLLFWVYGILTAYTQYYACVAVIAIYIAVFVFYAVMARKNKTGKSVCEKGQVNQEQAENRKTIQNEAAIQNKVAIKEQNRICARNGIGKVLLCAGLSVLAYLPWLPFFFSQVRTVSSSYWIQPLTWKSIFGCMKYIFLPVSYAVKKNYVLACVMILIFGAAFLYSFLMKRKDVKERFFLLTGLWIAVFTTFVGFVCSILNRPIFVYRYLIPCLGAMWLIAAVVLWDSVEKNWGILLFVPFLLAGHSNMQGFYGEENKKIVEMEATQSFLSDFPEDAVVLCNFDHVQAVTACYLKDSNAIYLYGSNPEELIAELLPQCRGLEDITELPKLVQEKDVYFFGSFNSREDLLKEWETEGIAYTEEGTYLLERYYFNVYHLVSVRN